MSEFLRKSALIGMTAFGVLVSSIAAAQVPMGGKMEPPPADSVLSGVTVSVPKVVETTRYGVVSSEVTMSVRVPYGDLNMQTPGGVAELNKRVDQAANYVCRQLVIMYPVGTPDTIGCVKEALGDARPQVIRASASR